MTGHVFARLAGFGLTVTPFAPFRMRYAEEPADAIDIEYDSAEGRLFARLIPDNGGYKSKIDQNTKSLYDVVDVDPGPDWGYWRIETTVFTCGWPAELALCSNSDAVPSPFDLVGDHGELVYVQHPSRVPDVADMCAPNQTVLNMERGSDADWIELEYEHGGAVWRQRHVVVEREGRRLAVTMQSPLDYSAEAATAAHQVARSLALYADDEAGDY